MKRSVLTALVLPSVVAVMLGGTALSAPMASAAPVSSSTVAAVPDDGGAAADPTSAPVPDAAAPAAEAAPAPVESAPAEAPVEVPAEAPVEAEPAESGPVESAPIEAPAADDASAPAPAPAPAPGTDEVVGIAAATEPGTVTIAGTTEFGDLQTAVTDGWPDGTTFTYQWTRDDAAIEGATAETYVLVRADIGRVVEVAVTGTGPAAGDEPTTVVSERRVAAGVPPTFVAQPGADLVVVAGEPFSFTWEAAGDPTPMVNVVSDPRTLTRSIPEGAVVTETPGSLTISGTSTVAGSYSFGVSTLNMVAIGETLAVDLRVAPGAPTSIFATVGTAYGTGPSTFVGVIGSGPGETISPVALDPGEGVVLAAFPGPDAFGNIVTPQDLPEGVEAVYSSSDPDDELVVREAGLPPRIDFTGPGTRVVTISLAGFTTSFQVDVRSAVVVEPAVSGATPISTSGSLAYTGSEPTDGLFALAAGLLAAGAALTVVRLRLRRRLQH